MNILKRWRGHDQPRDGQGLARQDRGRSGLARRHEVDDFRQRMDRMFERMWRDPFSALMSTDDEEFRPLAGWPALDMSVDEKSVRLDIDVPGMDEKDLEVDVSGNQLTIRGSRDEESSDRKRGVHHRERISGSFTRTVTLPSYVDTSKVEAEYKKGTLRITVPRIPGHGPRRITVNSG